MQKLPTISVGIPAYNEEYSIKNVLQSILTQQENNFVLKEVIIISDGSRDKTVEKVKSITDTRITIIDEKKRKGKSACLNQICAKSTGDIVILCDADIAIDNNKLFSTIIDHIDITKAGVAVPKFLLVKPVNFLGKCLKLSVDLQLEIMEKWNDGTNYLSFRGAFLILDKKLAKNLAMPENLINNDAYIYFKALAQHYQPVYLPIVSVLYRVPATLKDYRNQSSRYQSSFEELQHYLPIDKTQYIVPKFLYIKNIIKYFLLHPILFVSYILLRFYVRLFKNNTLTAKWTMATTTKSL